MDCAGLVQAIHSALISPRAAASKSSTAVLPDASGSVSTAHRRAISARCSALAGSRWPGSSVAMPPASRPPMALGWPVNEKGPAPARPICAVARCRLISAVFLAVPRLLWFRPMQYSDSVDGERAKSRAASSSCSSLMPQVLAAQAGVLLRTRALSASKPSVCRAMNSGAIQPSQMIACSMPLNSAISVPGRICRCRSASSAVSVRRGSTTMVFCCGRCSRAASMRRNRMGCAQAGLAPAMNRQSACSMSS